MNLKILKYKTNLIVYWVMVGGPSQNTTHQIFHTRSLPKINWREKMPKNQ